MNELDDKVLDQKSWSFLDLIGQPPLTFSITNILASGNITVITLTATNVFAPFVANPSGDLILAASTTFLRNDTDNSSSLVSVSFRWKQVFTPVIDSGTTDSLSFKTNQIVRITIANTGQLYPATDAAAAQTASGIFAGIGVPNNANGNNGDFYFRSDGGAGTCIYQRRAGAWVATGA